MKLDLAAMRPVNVQRAREGFKCYDNQPLTYWNTALTGEVGELCNMIKKIHTAPTTLFVPNLQYPHGCRVTVSDGTFSHDSTRQRLIYQQTAHATHHTLRLERRF